MFVVPPEAGLIITIYRDTPRSQGAAFTASDTINRSTLEQSVDKLTQHVQELTTDVARTLRIPTSDLVEVTDLTPQERKLALVGFDGDGELDLSVSIGDVRRIIVANPVNSMTNVTDYGSIASSVTGQVDYGSIA